MSLAFDESNHCHQTTLLMPPPKNIFRIGTKQCLKALKARSIELSLPEYQQDNLDDGDGKEAPFIAVGGLDEEEEEGKGGDKNNYGRLQLQEQFVVSPDDSGDDGQDETRPEDEEEVQHQESLEEEEEEEDPAGAPKENDDGSSKRKFDSISLISHESHEKTTVEDSTPVAETVVTKYQPPDPRLPRFCDIIGHGQVKLRCEEILLPLALPRHLANSILTGKNTMVVNGGII
mgnify:CR=1 FL=1